MPDTLIELRFPTVRSKLLALFPNDPKFDVQIFFKNHKYELQLAYLRIQSGFFRTASQLNKKIIKLQGEFKESHLENIMSCFYGGVANFKRKQVLDIFKIVKYLKIDSFLKILLKDMKQNMQKYNFFQLAQFAFSNGQQKIFQECLFKLHQKKFEQIRYYKEAFISLQISFFKFIIIQLNRIPRNEKLIGFIQVQNLINQYCKFNNFSQQIYKDLKFQLIPRTQLSAEQYQHIFMGGMKTGSVKQIPNIDQFRKKGKQMQNQYYLMESAILPSTQMYVLKEEQKKYWKQNLNSLKKSFQKHKQQQYLLTSSVQNIEKRISKKSEDNKNTKQNLTRLDKMMNDIQKELKQKKQNLKKLEERVNKLQTNENKNAKKKKEELIQKKEQEQDQFVQTMIIPGFMLGDIQQLAKEKKDERNQLQIPKQIQQPTASLANFSKKKKPNLQASQTTATISKDKIAIKVEKVDESYKQTLNFDKQPLSVPKKYLKCLSTFLINEDSFVKKKQLTLIYRRSSKADNIGDSGSIKNRNALLVLFETEYKKHAGGYISAQLYNLVQKQQSYIQDPKAFIFSLSHNFKCNVIKNDQKNAVGISKNYLLLFANDLQLSNDILNEDSYCSWPSSYESTKEKDYGFKELVGASQFKIKQIEIYEVKDQEIQMEI